MILHILRFLLRVKPPQISRTEALSIVRSECERRGWPCDEPIHIHGGLWRYEITTNARLLGGNVFMSIDVHSGQVRGAGFARK